MNEKRYPRALLIISAFCSLLNLGQTKDSCVLLIQAAETGQIEKVKLLLGRGVDINCRGPHQYTPLIAAAKSNHIEIVKLLCAHNANVNAKGEFADPEVDYTPLLWAIENCNLGMAELLLDHGADVNLADSWEDTPLIHAVRKGSLPLVKLLVANGAVVTYRRKASGRTAIFGALGHGNFSIVEFLVQSGEDPRTKDSDGWDLLMVASNASDLKAVKYLLDKGVDINNRAENGTTAMHLAAQHDSEDGLAVLNSLIKMGGNIMARDDFGITPFMEATHQGAAGAARILIEKGAKVNDVDKEDLTPLHLAVRGWWPAKKPEIVDLLLANGACVNARDKEGLTPLMVASGYSETQPIRALISHGAEIDAQDERGWTSLMYAASENQVGVIRLLVDHGADLNLRTTSGKTALKIAEDKERNREAYELLKSLGAKAADPGSV